MIHPSIAARSMPRWYVSSVQYVLTYKVRHDMYLHVIFYGSSHVTYDFYPVGLEFNVRSPPVGRSTAGQAGLISYPPSRMQVE